MRRRAWAYPLLGFTVACGTQEEATRASFGDATTPDAQASRRDAATLHDAPISFEAARRINDALAPNWCALCEESLGLCDKAHFVCLLKCSSGCNQAQICPYGTTCECGYEAGPIPQCVVQEGGAAMTLGGSCVCDTAPKITDAGPCPFGCALKTDAAGCAGRSFSGFQAEFSCGAPRSLWDGGRDAGESACLASCEAQTDSAACWYSEATSASIRDCKVCGADGGGLVFSGTEYDFAGTMTGSCGSGS